MKSIKSDYQSKLTSAEAAVAQIGSGANIAMGMAAAEPPALLKALADRIEAGVLDDLKLWYLPSLPHAATTLLRYELLGRVHPHCMFLSPIERVLIERGEAEGRKVVDFVPTAFSESSRLLSERVEIDTFVTTVSPMDRHGWFTFGTSNDYGSTVARSAKRLLVEVNPNMPSVFGECLLHVSEVDAIVENDVPLIEISAREPSSEE